MYSSELLMKTMLRSPAFFQELLCHEGLIGQIYDAMQKDDVSEVVIVVLDVLKKTKKMPLLVKEVKCKFKSNTYRQQGNKAYKDGQYQKALECYNKALMFAPKRSEELVFAYSNRSALMATCKLFEACRKDVSMCFSLGHPGHLTDKLRKRQEEAIKNIWMERHSMEMRYNVFAEEYLAFEDRRNPQINCANTDIGVIIESQVPKVVATRDVKVGKVIAIEQAFASSLDPLLKYTACYYCHRMALNLIPCEDCCSALFCDTKCMQTCMNDYHAIECPIIEIVNEYSPKPLPKLSIIAAIKLRSKFKSWDEFNTATLTVGLERMKMSEVNDIYDVNNKFSLLNFKDDKVFKHGLVYNLSFACAIVIHYLGLMNPFLPASKAEKEAAIRGFSRLLIYNSLNLIHTQISSTVTVLARGQTEFCNVVNFGAFALTGKLKAACNPNVLVVGLNNKVALVTIQPLRAGTELTIAYLGHWIDNNVCSSKRRQNMYTLYGTACACAICNGDWKLLLKTAKPTETQLRCVRKLNVENAEENYSVKDIDILFPKCCKALAFLSDLPFSKEYMDVYTLFRKCLQNIQDQHTCNFKLD